MSLNINAVRREALFASTAQGSESLSPAELSEAIMQTVRVLGSCGCTAYMAQEFGDHPETAVRRMRWAREQVDRLFASRANLHISGHKPALLRLAA
jgi:hypothetical protein